MRSFQDDRAGDRGCAFCRVGFDGKADDAKLYGLRLQAILRAHPAWKLQVVAHAPANDRAQIVVKYLAGKGVAADHLQAVGRNDANSVDVELNIVSRASPLGLGE